MIRSFRKLHQFQRGFSAAETVLEKTIGRSTCISGCGLCCAHNTVQCMTIEAMNAVSVLAGLGSLNAIVSIAEGYLLEKHNEAPTYEGMISGRFIPPHIMAQYHALAALPCPFLAENKDCLIYEARPLVCQAYGVTRDTAGGCPRSPGRGETLTQRMYMQVPGLQADIRRFKEKTTVSHPEWVIFGLLPTLIYRAAREKEFRKLVLDNRIASAKIIGTQLDMTLLWQPQVEALQKGVAPDLVVAVT